MGLDAEGQRGVGALEDTGTKNKRDGKCPVNKELTISMQRVTAALKAPSVLFCKVQRPIQVYATSLYVFIGLDLYLISASKEDAKHRTKLFKRSTTLRWTDAEGTDREQNLVQTRADQDTGGGSMIAPLTPNLVLLVFFLLKGSSSFPLSQSACSSSDCWVFSATSHHR